jgi:hypothetical protein
MVAKDGGDHRRGDGNCAMPEILENILIMILTIVVLVVGGYLALAFLGWWLKIRSGGREAQGLTDLWMANQPKPVKSEPDSLTSDDDP